MTPDKSHRLLVKVKDKSKPTMVDQDGRIMVPIKWIEVQEIDLGSWKKPNLEILSFKYVPIILARGEE